MTQIERPMPASGSEEVIIPALLNNKRKRGTLNQGIEYEQKICALISLRAAIFADSVKEFWITQNIDDPAVGKFDDIILAIQNANNEIATYCIQLKHFGATTRDDIITYASFQQEFIKQKKIKQKNQLYLESYFQTIRKSIKLCKDKTAYDPITYILFTNKVKDDNEKRFVTMDDKDLMLLNTGGTAFKLLAFQTYNSADDSLEDVDAEVLQRFIVFSSQAHEESLESMIENTLKEYFHQQMERVKEVALKYIKYIMSWAKGTCGGDRILSKNEIKFKLSEFLINAYVSQLPLTTAMKPNHFHKKWETITKNHKVVFVEENGRPQLFQNIIHLLAENLHSTLQMYSPTNKWDAVFSKHDLKQLCGKCPNSDRVIEELIYLWCDENPKITLQMLHFYLWKENVLPLVLRIENEDDLRAILIISKFATGRIILLYVGLIANNVRKSIFDDHLESFTFLCTFEHLQASEKLLILNQWTKLQGRRVQIKDVWNEWLASHLLTLDIAQILLHKFNIGEKFPDPPKLFIERHLSSIIVKPEIFKFKLIYIIDCESQDDFLNYAKECKMRTHKSLTFTLSKFKNTSLKIIQNNPLILPTAYKILLNKDFTNNEIFRAIDKGNKNDVEFISMRFEMGTEKNKLIKCNESFHKTVNVIICKEDTLNLFFKRNSIVADASEIYDISEININNIPITCKYIISREENILNAKRPNIPLDTMNIHYYKLITTRNNKIVLEFLGSFGECNIINKFINFNVQTNTQYAFTNCYKYNNLNLICGSPGMGKSVLINYLMRMCPTDFYVVFMNFNDNLKYFSDNTISKNANIIEHIKHFLNYNSLADIERSIVDMYFRNRRICFFFDGYDEIEPDLENGIIIFLNYLLNERFFLFVTTRTIQVEKLQTNLNSTARSLIPFSEENQYEYLIKYYESKYPNCKKSIQTFVSKLLSSSRKNMSAWDLEFAGIPLQTVMISEIYLKKCEQYCDSVTDLHLNVHILHLYELFINFKIASLKEKDQINDPKLEKYFNKSIELSLENHELCALRAIFHVAIPEVDLSGFVQEIKNRKDKIGLIEKFLEDDTPVFVHRTFAEYLVGLYISKNFQKPFTQDIILKMYRNRTYDIIRQILDRLLTKYCPIHKALLDRDDRLFKHLLKSNEELQKTDEAGRTVLHLAMSWGTRHDILENENLNDLCQQNSWIAFQNKLMDIYTWCKGGETNYVDLIMRSTRQQCFKKDHILNGTPLEYGVNVLALGNIDVFLKHIFVNECSYDKVTDGLTTLFQYEAECKITSLLSIFNKKSSTITNMALLSTKQVLFVCSLLDYVHIGSAVINRKPVFYNIDVKFGAYEFSLLHFAALADATKVIDLLTKEGMDVNVVEKREWQTPLHFAARRGNASSVQLLLERRANVKSLDVGGQTALYCASVNRHHPVAKLLEEAEYRSKGRRSVITKLCIAAAIGDYEEVNALLLSGKDPNEASEGGMRPLIEAAWKGHLDLVKLLLDFGADVNVCNDHNVTSLMYASAEGQIEIVGVLLSWGANKDLMAKNGMSALTLASEYGHVDVAQMIRDTSFAIQ